MGCSGACGGRRADGWPWGPARGSVCRLGRQEHTSTTRVAYRNANAFPRRSEAGRLSGPWPRRFCPEVLERRSLPCPSAFGGCQLSRLAATSLQISASVFTMAFSSFVTCRPTWITQQDLISRSLSIAPAKTLFPNKFPFTDARGQDVDTAFGGHRSTQNRGYCIQGNPGRERKLLNKWPLMLESPLSFISYNPTSPLTSRRDELLSFP